MASQKMKDDSIRYLNACMTWAEMPRDQKQKSSIHEVGDCLFVDRDTGNIHECVPGIECRAIQFTESASSCGFTGKIHEDEFKYERFDKEGAQLFTTHYQQRGPTVTEQARAAVRRQYGESGKTVDASNAARFEEEVQLEASRMTRKRKSDTLSAKKSFDRVLNPFRDVSAGAKSRTVQMKDATRKEQSIELGCKQAMASLLSIKPNDELLGQVVYYATGLIELFQRAAPSLSRPVPATEYVCAFVLRELIVKSVNRWPVIITQSSKLLTASDISEERAGIDEKKLRRVRETLFKSIAWWEAHYKVCENYLDLPRLVQDTCTRSRFNEPALATNDLLPAKKQSQYSEISIFL